MAKKYYAIKKGMDPDTGLPVENLIFEEWNTAQKYVKGISHVIYKSFKSEQEANDYLKDDSSLLNEHAKKTTANNKIYAIYKGICPKTGMQTANVLLDNWEKAFPYVDGVSDARYESFKSLDFFKINNDIDAFQVMFDHSSGSSLKHEDIYRCYVDGSFNEELGNYGGGLVVALNDDVVHAKSYLGTNAEAVKMRQVGGELLGAIQACLYAKRVNAKHIIIFYDYMGVQNHVDGTWKPNSQFSKTYHNWMNSFIKKHASIKVEFQHVKAHSGDALNELVDGYAKIAVGVGPEKGFWKLKESLIKDNINVT